jgi:hypothetical protein
MSDEPSTEQVRSLATVRDGEALLVEHILFEANRSRLAEAGIGVGDRVRCRISTPSHVYVETPVGIVVGVERSCASFVQVTSLEALDQVVRWSGRRRRRTGAD